jgi:hypothetical protein
MSIEPKLEAYLNALDRALGQIPISDRAEIITEIKSHVLDSQKKHPEQDIDLVLNSLGEPETVANRYLLERGLKVGKPTKTPMVKWLTIGFLGTLSISVSLLALVLWKFTPIISVDNEKDRVVILGGLIDIHGKSKKSHFGSGLDVRGKENETNIDGSKEIGKSVQQILVSFNNGIFKITSEKQNEIKWQCQGTGQDIPILSEYQETLKLAFDKMEGAVCHIQLPSNIKLDIQGVNGQIEIFKPKSGVDVQLENGKIHFEPDSQLKYKYQIQVENGYAESFFSSDSKDAISVKLNLKNGSIRKK